MIYDHPLEVLSIKITERTFRGCSINFLHAFQQKTDTKKWLLAWAKFVSVSNIQDLTEMIKK